MKKRENSIFYKKYNNDKKVELIRERLATYHDTLSPVEEEVILSEGCILEIYKDSLGYDTVGIGNLIENEAERKKYADGMTIEEAMRELRTSLATARQQAKKLYGKDYFKTLNHTRQEVLTELCFNLGYGSLRGFKNMNEYIKRGDFRSAGAELIFRRPFGANKDWDANKYTKQVGVRALVLASKLITGSEED